MNKLEEIKIKDFDDIFYATRDSQGYINTVIAIKYVLFGDDSMFKIPDPLSNKYLYISATNDARRKAMLLQQDDLAHIVVKYCMQSFGLRASDFNFTHEEIDNLIMISEKKEISPYEMIELVATLAISDVYLAYQVLFQNVINLTNVVEYMIEERYISNFKERLDNFTGIIENKEMSTERRYDFYDAYIDIDRQFGEIKRNNPDYIR